MISALADIGKNWLCLPKCSFLFIRIRGHVRFHFILYPLVLNVKYLHHTLQVLVARFFCTAFLSQSAHFLQSAVTSQKIIILTIIFNSCSSPQYPPRSHLMKFFKTRKYSSRMRTAHLLTGKGYGPEGGECCPGERCCLGGGAVHNRSDIITPPVNRLTDRQV